MFNRYSDIYIEKLQVKYDLVCSLLIIFSLFIQDFSLPHWYSNSVIPITNPSTLSILPYFPEFHHGSCSESLICDILTIG